jgi:hypothetical protein
MNRTNSVMFIVISKTQRKEKMASVVYLPWTQNNGQEFMSTYIITEGI